MRSLRVLVVKEGSVDDDQVCPWALRLPVTKLSQDRRVFRVDDDEVCPWALRSPVAMLRQDNREEGNLDPLLQARKSGFSIFLSFPINWKYSLLVYYIIVPIILIFYFIFIIIITLIFCNNHASNSIIIGSLFAYNSSFHIFHTSHLFNQHVL